MSRSSPNPPSSKPGLEQAGASDESIQQVHSILLREKPEPSEGFTPMPLFLLGFISAMIFVCSIYMVHYRGGFDPLVTDERFDPSKVAASTGPKERTPEQIIASGKRLFATCATCHQPTGLGVAGVYPPLVGSEQVLGREAELVRILLHGLNGPIVVKGNTYNGAMPAFGRGSGYNWSDEKIADVLTYIRQEWGNNAAPITTATVEAIRKAETRSKPWTEAELHAVP